MSTPLRTSFGYTAGFDSYGHVYNVQVPTGSLGAAILLPLIGNEDSESEVRDLIFVSNGTIDTLLVALDANVPGGSNLRTNVYNSTQAAYLINVDISAGNKSNSGSGSLAVAEGDQIYLALVDTTGAGFLISRLQWHITS